MKSTKNFKFKNVTAIIIACVMVVFTGCEKDNDIQQSANKEKIYALADKYGLNISLQKIDDTTESKITDFDELESLFKVLANRKNKKYNFQFTNELQYEKNEMQCNLIQSKELQINRLKNGSIEGDTNPNGGGELSKWFYDATTFRVSLSWTRASDKEVTLTSTNSWYTGVGCYEYTHKNGYIHNDDNRKDDVIHFKIVGAETFKVPVLDWFIWETNDVTCVGNYNIETGTGGLYVVR